MIDDNNNFMIIIDSKYASIIKAASALYPPRSHLLTFRFLGNLFLIVIYVLLSCCKNRVSQAMINHKDGNNISKSSNNFMGILELKEIKNAVSIGRKRHFYM